MATHRIAPVRTNPVLMHPGENGLSLDGNWAFRLDPEDKGVSEGWFRNPQMLSDSVGVPGCWQGRGHGTDAKEALWDFGGVHPSAEVWLNGVKPGENHYPLVPLGLNVNRSGGTAKTT